LHYDTTVAEMTLINSVCGERFTESKLMQVYFQ